MAVLIQRPVTVKAKVTEALKKRLAAEFQETLRQAEAELAQLEAQAKRLAEQAEGPSPERRAALERLEAERRKRLDQKNRLLDNLKELARLEPGAEITQGTVQGLIQVKAGDDWERVFQAELVVEDGRVVAIRE
ncbi:MAG: YlqD family protein [Bacillota bacterium]